jgi:hypothetical protein
VVKMNVCAADTRKVDLAPGPGSGIDADSSFSGPLNSLSTIASTSARSSITTH